MKAKDFFIVISPREFKQTAIYNRRIRRFADNYSNVEDLNRRAGGIAELKQLFSGGFA